MLRIPVKGIEDVGDFDRMITAVDEAEPEIDASVAVAPAEYAEWQQRMMQVKVPYTVLEIIHKLKEQIEDYNRGVQNDDAGGTSLYISDRRWKKLVRLLRASAFLNEADEVHVGDCLLIRHALWNEPGQWEWVDNAVRTAIRRSVEGYLLNIEAVDHELNQLKEEMKIGRAHV